MKRSKMTIYRYRDRTLRDLGYKSYAEYLVSPAWKNIREIVFKRKGRICELCGGEASEVHHKSYNRSTLTGRNLGPLIPLCRECHQAVEYTPSGKKRTAADTSSEFYKRKHRKYNTEGNCFACGKTAIKGMRFCIGCWRQFKKGLPLGRNLTPSKYHPQQSFPRISTPPKNRTSCTDTANANCGIILPGSIFGPDESEQAEKAQCCDREEE